MKGKNLTEDRHLLLISLDAVSDEDVDYLLEQPNFSELCSKGTLMREVESVFVSNTYPAHTSVVTGVHPQKHGLIEIVFTQPGNDDPEWRYDSKYVHAPTLYDMAKSHGKTICSILYPVMCGADVDWNFPEVPGKMSIIKRAATMLCGGNAAFILSTIGQFIKTVRRISVSDLDNFTTKVASDALCRYKPGLTMVHLLDVDNQKHAYGPHSKEAQNALKRHDQRIGDLAKAWTKAYPDKSLQMIIFSDHGCLDVNEAFDPNEYLKRKGFIHGQGKKPSDYDAFFHNAGGTAFLKVYKPEQRKTIVKTASDILLEPYVRRMLTTDEMKVSGMDNEFEFGIEAAEGFCFGKYHKGQHGYSLKHKGYQPFYLAIGRGVKPGKIEKGGGIIDICPLAADLLNIPKWEMDGQNRLF